MHQQSGVDVAESTVYGEGFIAVCKGCLPWIANWMVLDCRYQLASKIGVIVLRTLSDFCSVDRLWGFLPGQSLVPLMLVLIGSYWLS